MLDSIDRLCVRCSLIIIRKRSCCRNPFTCTFLYHSPSNSGTAMGKCGLGCKISEKDLRAGISRYLSLPKPISEHLLQFYFDREFTPHFLTMLIRFARSSIDGLLQPPRLRHRSRPRPSHSPPQRLHSTTPTTASQPPTSRSSNSHPSPKRHSPSQKPTHSPLKTAIPIEKYFS